MTKSKTGNPQIIRQDSTRTVDFWLLFLMCVNSMSGAGVFINARPLAFLAGRLSAVAYLVGIAVMLPIVFTLTGLAQKKPVAGGLYKYAKDELGVVFGFLSGWSYFLAKVVSAAVLAQAFTVPLKTMLPQFSVPVGIAIDTAVLGLIVTLNILGVKIYGKVQFLFSLIKSVPYLAIIAVSGIIIFLGRFENFLQFDGGASLISAFPCALFATSGFEIANTMAHKIKNPETTIRRTVLAAFSLVGILYIAFQVGAQLLCGPELGLAANPFAFVASKLQNYFGIAGSAVGIFMKMTTITITFSLLTNNCWNLFAIAKDELLPFSASLTKVNSKDIPWVCLLVEMSLATFIMSVTENVVALQAMSVFATGVSFIFCALAGVLYWNRTTKNVQELTWAALSVVSCLIILGLSAKNIMAAGLSTVFLAVFFSGILLALVKFIKKSNF